MEPVKKVLLIDDDPINNHLSSFIIKKVSQYAGVEIISFTDPEKGCQYIENNYLLGGVTTILFLDINMPVLTGWDVLDKIKGLGEPVLKHFRIYILSSFIDTYDIKKAESNHLVKGFISKPLSAQISDILHELA